MTTKENVKEKVMSMVNDLIPYLNKQVDKLLDSGVIDFEQEDDNFKLPKHIMQVLGKKITRSYTNPHATRKDKQQIRQLDNIF